MDIFIPGQQSSEEVAKSLLRVFSWFKESYHINQYSEIHLVLTLMDNEGHEVELVDSNTSEVYRQFEVCLSENALINKKSKAKLHLVVDNTREKK